MSRQRSDESFSGSHLSRLFHGAKASSLAIGILSAASIVGVGVGLGTGQLTSSTEPSTNSVVSPMKLADLSAVTWADTHASGSAGVQVLSTDGATYQGKKVFEVKVLAPNNKEYDLIISATNFDVLSSNEVLTSDTSSTKAEPVVTTTTEAVTPPSSTTTEAPKVEESTSKVTEPTSETTVAPTSTTTEVKSTMETSSKPPSFQPVALITILQAEAAAQAELGSLGAQGTTVSDAELISDGGEFYYLVELSLQGGGDTKVWVDATSSSAVVTGVNGGGYQTTDSNLVSVATAGAAAVSVLGGGSVSSVTLVAGYWPYYEILVQEPNYLAKVAVSATTGVVVSIKNSD